MNKDLIIIGAGISGLTVAHYLIEKGYNITIYEKDKVVGGMARSVRDNNGVPTEHSWRGYGPFYYNLFNLIKQIPDTNNKKSIESFEDSYSLEEVEKHTSKDDLWTYYKGNVYDVTKFVNSHPGGSIILNSGGKDLEKVWEEYGYGWHNRNPRVLKALEKFKIGKLKENMDSLPKSNNKSVFDNLNHSKLKFNLLKDNRTLNSESIKLTTKDWIFLFILFGRVVLADKRRDKYFKMRLDPILKKYLSYEGYLYITYFLCGPGYGFDKNTISVGHFGLFAYFSMRESEKLWEVMSKPTNEAWFDPWVDYLVGKGVKINLNSELEEIIIEKGICKGLKIKNKDIITNVNSYCMAINPFNLEKILKKSRDNFLYKEDKLKIEPLILNLEKGNIVNNQISFRLGLSEKFNFGDKNSAFVLVDSEYNITFYAQEDHWIKDTDLGLNGKIKTLISGTLILTYELGKLYRKPATSLKKEELLNEIVRQFKDSIQFNKLLKDNMDPMDSMDHLDFYEKIIYREIFEDWEETKVKSIDSTELNQTILTSKNLKWVNNSINEEYRISQYYPNICKNLFFSGGHTKTSIVIWSMEGSVESGLLTVNKILEKDNRVNEQYEIYNHRVSNLLIPLQKIDNFFYSLNIPSVFEVILFLILYFIIIIIKIFIENKFKESI